MLVAVFALAVASSPANVVKRQSENGQVVFDGVLFVTEDLVTVQSEFNTSAASSVLPRGVVKTLPTNIYTYRMTKNSPFAESNTQLSSSTWALVAPARFAEFSLILNLYKTDFFFLSKPPVEMTPHLLELGCTSTLPGTGTGLDFAVTGGTSNISAVVSHSVARHTIADPSICGLTTLFVSNSIAIPVWIDCTKSTPGTSTVLSGPLLQIGFYNGESEFCVYLANNDEINHALAITLVTVLFLFIIIWIDWTRNLWDRINNQTSQWVWETCTVAFGMVVYQIIVLTVSMNIYARAQRSHNIYSFSVLRMLPKATVDATAYVYSYITSPILGGTCLIIMAIGRLTYGPNVELSNYNFTWGTKALEKRSLRFRLAITAVALGCIGAIIYGIWFVGLRDQSGAIATIITTFPAIVHSSTPRWLTRKLKRFNAAERIDMALPATIVYFSWAIKFLTITCLCNNLPFDVAGQLNTAFHRGVTFSMGFALLIITGRDLAHILILLRLLSTMKRHVATVGVLCIMGFVVWYASIFNLGGMFSHGGALQNHGDLATLCAGGFANLVVVISFAIHVDNGIEQVARPKANDKRPGVSSAGYFG